MEDYIEFKDYLCYSKDKDIRKMIKGEQLLFSDKAKTIITIGFSKERTILLTNKAFYILDTKSKLILILIFRNDKKDKFRKNYRYNNQQN